MGSFIIPKGVKATVDTSAAEATLAALYVEADNSDDEP